MSVAARRYYLRGRAALDRGDTDQAIESLASAIDLAPHFADARVAYAAALCRLGDTPRAAQTLRAGLGYARTAASRAALSLTLGEVLTTAGDFPGAHDAFAQAAAHPPLAARASAGRARALAKTGHYRDAVAALLLAARGG
jgi:tetratricopeptide (TPR) repeat protein